MSPQPQTNGHDKTYDFAPVDYDASTVPPRIGAGRYDAVLACSARPTAKDNLPMLVLEWTAQAVIDGTEENEQFVGQSISDFLVLSDDSKFRGHKLRLRTLLERLEIDYAMVPKRIENKGDLEELLQTLTDRTLSITVVHKVDKNGENRENVEYRLPRGDADASGDDADVAQAAPARGRSPAKPAPKGKGKAARR